MSATCSKWGFTSTADKFFLRLRYSDIPTSDPFNADFDGDKVNNFAELANGTDPLKTSDADEDGLPDDWETARGLNFENLGDAILDSDFDGNSNAREFQQNTDPNNYASRALPLIVLLEGDGQLSAPSSRLPIAMVVRVTDAVGVPLHNSIVGFHVSAGGGVLARTPSDPQPSATITGFTDENGLTGVFYQQPGSLDTPSSVVATVASRPEQRTVTFSARTVASPLTNDHFANAQLLTGGEGSIDSTNVGASIEQNEPTFLTLEYGAISPQRGNVDRQTGATVWFTWQAPETRRYRFQTSAWRRIVSGEPGNYFGHGTDFDTVLAVYRGTSLPALILTAGNDNIGTVESGAEFDATAGVTYRIAVDGAEGETGKFFLCWYPASPPLPPGPPPANDAFATAEDISGLDGEVTGTTVDATEELGEPSHQFHEGQRSVWYRWVAAESGTVLVDTAGSEFNSILGIYQGAAVNALSEITWNDDDTESLRAKVSFTAVSGQTYYFMVDGFGVEAGSLRLSWRKQVPPPVNDAFSAATQVVNESGMITGSVRGATSETDEPAHAGNGPGQSIWYRWIAPATDAFTFRTTGSAFDTVMGIYAGTSIGSLTEIAANDDGDGLQSVASFDAQQGAQYFIAVDAYGGSLPLGQDASVVLGWERGAPLQPFEPSAPPPGNPLLPANTDHPPHGAAAAAAEEEECEDPPQPNKGDAFVSDADKTIILLAPKEGEPPITSCPVTINIIHSIVTTNTPRERDLHGKLRLFVDGDSSLISLGGYTPGTPIAVTEEGHWGCDVHDWHRGVEPFTLTGLKKGSVSLRAEVDPDPETPEGDGGVRTTATVNVQIVEIADVVIYHPSTESDADWQSSGKALKWHQIINKDEPLKFKVVLSSAIPESETIDLCSVKFALFKFDDDPNQVTWIDVSAASQRLAPSRNEVWITVDASTVTSALTPFNSSETEFASIEAVGSANFSDSDTFDGRAKQAANAKYLVPARDAGNETDQQKSAGGVSIPPFTAAAVGDYARYGGAVYIQAKAMNTKSKRRLYRNQADLLYISGHGSSAAGSIASVMPGTVDWKDDLDIVIMAGCSVLDINDYNGNYDDDATPGKEPGPTSKVFPGEQWATTGPRLLLGYNYMAPLDTQGSPGIIASWFSNRGAGDIEAWRIANNNSAGRNACAIDTVNGVYYYFKKSGKFFKSYIWTAVPRSQW